MGTHRERPPTSGAGSSVGAWREYAAAVTDSPVESWASLSRDEIVELLDAEGSTTEPTAEADAAPESSADTETSWPAKTSAAAERSRGPEWMVPTSDGMVPEHALRQRERKR